MKSTIRPSPDKRALAVRFADQDLDSNCYSILATNPNVTGRMGCFEYPDNPKTATYSAVHVRAGLSRRFCELAVFDARLYIRVRRVDQPA